MSSNRNTSFIAMLDERRELQVSGLKCFPPSEWKDAILYYLKGLRLGLNRVTYRPKIMFGSYTLRLDAESGRYFAYGPDARPSNLCFPEAQVLWVGDTAEEVELGLVEFLRTETIRMIVVCFDPQGYLFLWKEEDGSYGVSPNNLPDPFGDMFRR